MNNLVQEFNGALDRAVAAHKNKDPRQSPMKSTTLMTSAKR